jgi:GntR family transcriptional regulator
MDIDFSMKLTYNETIKQYFNETIWRQVLNALTGRIHLDFRSEEPLYIQMVRQIELLVKDGSLKPGDQLPTVRELAIEQRVNFSTIARVYRILDEQKLISTQRGRGTYIWDEPTVEMMQLLKKKSLEELTQNYYAEVLRLGYNLEDALEELRHIPSPGTNPGNMTNEKQKTGISEDV